MSATCVALVAAKNYELCGKPAKARVRLVGPVCGVHLRAAIANGEAADQMCDNRA